MKLSLSRFNHPPQQDSAHHTPESNSAVNFNDGHVHRVTFQKLWIFIQINKDDFWHHVRKVAEHRQRLFAQLARLSSVKFHRLKHGVCCILNLHVRFCVTKCQPGPDVETNTKQNMKVSRSVPGTRKVNRKSSPAICKNQTGQQRSHQQKRHRNV